jgi:hypothetical protein
MTTSSTPRHLWNAQHELQTVTFHLNFYDHGDGPEQSLSAHGRTDTKRSALWSYNEHFGPAEDMERGYSAADAIHHIALVAVQDKPAHLSQLNIALRGGVSWGQDPMFE